MASRLGIVNLLVECGRGAPRLVEREHLVETLARAMAAAGRAGQTVDLTLVDDPTIHALNLRYADEDHATDVLSFAQQEGEAMPGDAALLGDIVIAVPTARRQARAGKRRLVDELVHLAVHGFCHLLGYDHRTPHEERVMFGYEAELRAAATRRRLRRVSPPPSSAAASRRPARGRAARRPTS